MIIATRLVVGDVVRVSPGMTFPADGSVIEGRSSVEEAVLTGESRPRDKQAGDPVLAGSINRESPLIVRVTACGESTRLAAIARMIERAASERPRAARLADRVAAWFVAVLLAIAAAAGLAWLQIDPSRAVAVTFAVLVVSCPCALSLATPAALASAAGALGREKILAVRGDALETLAKVTDVVFDKTGTLTDGQVKLESVLALSSLRREDCLGLAAALEQGSGHPIGRALLEATPRAAVAHAIVSVPGCGVEGVIAGARYRLGRPAWAGEIHGKAMPALGRAVAPDATPIALAGADGWLALFTLADTLRPQTPALIATLRRLGLRVFLLSGDRDETARRIATAAGIDESRGGATPDDKRAYIAALQRDGAIVAMVGDGINDAPSLAQADVSLSLGSASAVTQWTADIVVLDDDVGRIADAITVARRTFGVIRQNLGWAFAYNLIAIPLAATGQLSPLAAALGMSVSSLLVVGNALRLTRIRPSRPRTASVGRAASASAPRPAWRS